VPEELTPEAGIVGDPAKQPGAPNHRAWVGPAHRFDTIAAQQFNLLTLAGLRENNTLLDIGCGSLRAGRLFLSYLQPGNYFGLEPEKWVLEEGIREMLGQEFIALRRPTFSHDHNFTLTELGGQFDFLLAQSIFSHTSQEQLHRCFAQAREVVGPHSKFFATFIPGEVDYDGDEWVYPGCVNFRRQTMRRIAGEHGFTMKVLGWPHPAQTWALFRPVEAPKQRLPFALRRHRRHIKRLNARLASQQAELSRLRSKNPRARVSRLLGD
jgi:hypothetical protein